MPHFAVIIPLYNKAPYVARAVESVLAQTCADWELWVVDDGSTDGSAEEVKAYIGPTVHLHQQTNAGVGAARNKGVALSGEAKTAPPYLCFLDADDWWEPTFLEEMAALIGRHPDAGIYGTSYYIVKNDHKRIAPIGVDDGFAEGEINYFKVYSRTLCMPLWTGAVCMSRMIFETTDGFPEGIKLGEDFLLWVKIALQHSVVLLNKSLSNYNQDADPTYRGTGRLHPPEQNMLWNLQQYEAFESTKPDYKQLVDRLRCYNLLPYYTDRSYQKYAVEELKKVDWRTLPASIGRLYRMPVWILRHRSLILRIGSLAKQRIISLRKLCVTQ